METREIKLAVRKLVNEIMKEDSAFVVTLRQGVISAGLLGEAIDSAAQQQGFERNAFYEVMTEETIWQHDVLETTKSFLHKEIMKYMEDEMIKVEKHRGRR